MTYLLPNVSSDVDALRVVAYWYDRRHGSAVQTLDDIDLRVDVTNSPGQTSYRYSADSYDEKESIFVDLSNYGQVDIDINLTGHNVTASNEGCGLDAMRVYLGYYYEDTDRDDYDGPGTEIKAP